jgi:hypothetical protein
MTNVLSKVMIIFFFCYYQIKLTYLWYLRLDSSKGLMLPGTTQITTIHGKVKSSW